MTDITQPEALRLADLLDEKNAAVYRKHTTQAAAELRRLQAKIGDLESAVNVLSDVITERNRLEAQRDELLDALKKCSEQLTRLGYSANHADQAIAAIKATGEQA